MTLAVIGIGLLAGALGSMVGLGGGILIVPALTIFLDIPVKTAISASLISLVATSIMSVSVFSKRGFIHFELGFYLLVTTLLGSFLGSYSIQFVDQKTILILFVGLIVMAIYAMFNKLKIKQDSWVPAGSDDGQKFVLVGEFETPKGPTFYGVENLKKSIGVSFAAGCISGMLGVGGGIVQVPVMNILSKVPLKVSTATSSFIIGFTGLASAIVYILYDQWDLRLTSTLIIGVLAGSYVGSKLALKLSNTLTVGVFIAVLVATAIKLMLKVLE